MCVLVFDSSARFLGWQGVFYFDDGLEGVGELFKSFYRTYQAVELLLSFYGAGQSGLSFFSLIFIGETLHIVSRLAFYLDLAGDDYHTGGCGHMSLWMIESC